MDRFDGITTAGRKGIPYDWRAVLVEQELLTSSATLTEWVTDDALAQVVAPVSA